MDYKKIGQQIRALRKAKRLSQDTLAEAAGVSVTHMSHIETGNTKLSLPVLVAIATELEVSVDYLLFDFENPNARYAEQISDIISDCSAKDKQIILETVKALTLSLRTNK